MNVKKKLAISIFAIVVVASLLISYFLLANPQIIPSGNPPSSNWKHKLDNFATAITFDNGKVFVTDNPGNVQCLDASTGNFIWAANVGGWASNGHPIAVSNGIVYVGVGGGGVVTLSESSGKLLPLSFYAPVTTSWGEKEAPQQFFISDGRIFVYQNGWGVFNISNGDMFWESGELGLTVGNATYSATDLSPVFVQRTVRFNPNNGSIMWQVSGDASDPAIILQDRVILWNYNPDGSADEGKTLLCVNASTGQTIWQFNVNSRMYQPTEYNGVVLFGAYDGNFYALNLSDGSVAWKTKVTDQNDKATMPWQDIHYPLTPSTSLVQIDNQTNRAFWAFAFAQNGWGSVDVYSGVVCCLDLTNGHVAWKTPISQNTSTEGGSVNQFGLTVLNGRVYLTTGSDLWVFDQSTGSVQRTEHFDHYVLSPVAGYSQVLLAGDLNLSSYT
jgi:outer membrane protein assembly factor BamB